MKLWVVYNYDKYGGASVGHTYFLLEKNAVEYLKVRLDKDDGYYVDWNMDEVETED